MGTEGTRPRELRGSGDEVAATGMTHRLTLLPRGCGLPFALILRDMQTLQNGIEWRLLYAEPSKTDTVPTATVASLCDQADADQRLFATVTQNNLHPFQQPLSS